MIELISSAAANCDHRERLEFPFLCTNVAKGVAIWYEPYPDAQIDADIEQYRKHMGPNSFYAKAPRRIYAIRCRPRAAAGAHSSKLGREIAVDLKADAHFDECRSCP
jgi:hypothetical protein